MSTSRKAGKIIFVTAFAAFLATFNETFLNIGFTPIMNDLHVPLSTVQWLATAYMLGAAVMVPVSAFAYRSIPTRRLFLGSMALLVTGSVIGALAVNFPALLAGRIIQALGTGLLIPAGLSLLLLLSGALFLTDIASLTRPKLDIPSVILISLSPLSSAP